MADITPTEGFTIIGSMRGMRVEFLQVETATNGEDGVTFKTSLGNVKHVQVTGQQDGKHGPFSATWSGQTITVKAAAGADGDVATVSVMVVGFN